MPRVSTYLNFARSTEEAFDFYRFVFGTEFIARQTVAKRLWRGTAEDGTALHIIGPNSAPIAEADKDLVMHVELPILGGHVLMGTDAPESMGFSVTTGNNIYINLEPDTRAETSRLFNALSDGGKAEMPLQEMFWGDYFGSLVDRFGIRWMFNCASKE